MPYHVHGPDHPPGSIGFFEHGGRIFPSAQLAGQDKRSGEVLTFLANETEIAEWRDREYSRKCNNEYATPPFFDHVDDRFPDHYLHLSLTKPGMLAYTKSVQHGIEDRQTIIRPGKYLTEHYSDLGPETIARFAGMVTASAIDLHIARGPDEIETAYTASHGSCMYTGKRHLRELPEQPVRAYGNSDLAVAYTGPIADVTARCIVWPERMIYNRPYGHTSLIEALLKTAGYRQGRLEGSKIRAIKYRHGGFIVPYVDGVGSGSLSDCGKFIVLDDSGPIDLHNTSGIANGHTCDHCGSACSDDNGGLCESCADETFTCEDCGNRYGTDDSNYVEDHGDYCNRCYSRNFSQCNHCDHVITSDDTRTVDGVDYCDECFSERFSVCDHCSEPAPCDDMRSSEVSGDYYCPECWECQDRTCVMLDCETEWNEYDVFDYSARQDRKRSKTNDLCETCASRYCHTCESTHDPDDCQTIADAESDGFGVACYDPDGTPWQIGLPLSFATVGPEPEPEPTPRGPEPEAWRYYVPRQDPLMIVVLPNELHPRSWRHILSPPDEIPSME